MELKLATEMVVGTAKSGRWGQVAVVPRQKGQELILLLLKYVGESDVLDVGGIGAATLETLRAQGRLAENQEALLRMVRKVVREVGRELELSCVVARCQEEQLTIVGKGAVAVYLRRGGQWGEILTGGREVRGVRGKVREGDIVMLASTELVRVVGLEGIKRGMESAEGMEELVVLVHGHEDSSEMVGIVGRVEAGAIDKKRERGWNERGDWWRRKLKRVRGGLKRIRRKPLRISREKARVGVKTVIGLVMLLGVGIAVGAGRRTKLVKEAAYTDLTEIVKSKLVEAEAVVDLNPERAKLLLAEASGEVESYLRKTKDEKYRVRARELEEKIREEGEKVFRKEEVKLQTLVELERLEGGVKGEKMTGDGKGNLFLVDEQKHRVVGVNGEDKSSWVVKVSGTEKVEGVAADTKELYTVSSRGVEVAPVLGGDGEQKIEPDELWKKVTEIEVYAGNVYLLDSEQGEIWKYPRISTGFGARRRWLGAGIVLDFSKVVDMKVDGEIWIITTSGKLERYSRGVPVSFAMEGFPAEEGGRLNGPVAVATDEERVYVLETGVGRVVVFNKESGKYERQLVNESFKKGKELVVEGGRGYVLLNGRVEWFKL